VTIGGVSASAQHLFMPLTTLVGRHHELQGVSELLRRQRLVTLVGPGGIGKTRLAREVARRQPGRHADGVWWVDLTSVSPSRDPAAEVARTLNVGGASTQDPTDSLRQYLADRDLLVLLDNCEHVVEGSADLVSALLGSCERLRIMATSREPLRVEGETVWRLEPLAADDAVRLFVERARQREPLFVPDGRDSATIIDLCERVDRVPLAIELAAGRIGVMSPAEILAGLGAGLGALAGGRRSAHSRHRSAEETVDWSYRLLDPVEQRALRSLAVMSGGFDLVAAAAVAPDLTIDVLARLVDKSVVVAAGTRRGPTRYRLLETVREFAAARLRQADELDGARERHLAHFATLEADAQLGWPSWRAEELLDRHADDYRNVRAALEWALDSDPCAGLGLFAATRDLFLMIGQGDGRRLAGALLHGCPGPSRARVDVLITAGILSMAGGNGEPARAFFTEAGDLARTLHEPERAAWALFYRGLSLLLDKALPQARADLEVARQQHQSLGSRRGDGLASATLGLTHLMTGEPQRAKELLEYALAAHIATGYRWGEGHASLYLGMALDATDPKVAAGHYRHAFECLHTYRDETLLPNAFIGQASLLAPRDPSAALRITAAAWSMRLRAGGDLPPLFRDRMEQVKSACWVALGPEAEVSWAQGLRLRPSEASALAFGTSARRPPLPAGLSSRELEVVRLVAEGLPNKSVASRLHVSVRTVESHVRNILAKAGLANRTELTAWAHHHLADP